MIKSSILHAVDLRQVIKDFQQLSLNNNILQITRFRPHIRTFSSFTMYILWIKLLTTPTKYKFGVALLQMTNITTLGICLDNSMKLSSGEWK